MLYKQYTQKIMHRVIISKSTNYFPYGERPCHVSHHHEKQRSSQRKCREHLSDLPSRHDNATHQGIHISQPCYEEKCMERVLHDWDIIRVYSFIVIRSINYAGECPVIMSCGFYMLKATSFKLWTAFLSHHYQPNGMEIMHWVASVHRSFNVCLNFWALLTQGVGT